MAGYKKATKFFHNQQANTGRSLAEIVELISEKEILNGRKEITQDMNILDSVL